jgi:peroxiredoxin
MAETPSNMLPLGTTVPPFQLTGVDGAAWSPEAARGKPLFVAFICNHCPFVVHIRKSLVATAHEYLDKGVAVAAINANSVETHPQDGPDAMRELAAREHWRFPFLFDATQEVARAFRAACTPDLYLFDRDHKLVYRGQFDDSRPGNGKPVTGESLRAAMEAVLQGGKPSTDQKPSIGCNIKWMPGGGPGKH